jgi:SAM-dependent methyltransferase
MSVLEFYNNNALSFSKTRYRVWCCVKRFLSSREINSSIYELGCGNGKNLEYCKLLGFTNISGSDITPNLVNICKKKGLNVVVHDILTPLDKKYELVMCIAVLHHLDTHEKRVIGFINFLDCIKPNGKGLLTVWSLEQGDAEKPREFTLGDNLITWQGVKNRYYYIFSKDTLTNFLEEVKKVKEFNYTLEWECQNWNVYVSL